MQIEEKFTIPFKSNIVWNAFKNLELIVSCLPGAKLISSPNEVPLQIGFQVKLGPIVANFTGTAEVTFDDAHHVGSFKGQGSDQKSNSRVKGEANFSLLDLHKNSTDVVVNTEFFLSGSLAQFGRIGILKEVASIITAQFAENLKLHLESLQDELFVHPVASLEGDSSPISKQTQAQSLNLFSLILKIIKSKFYFFVNSNKK